MKCLKIVFLSLILFQVSCQPEPTITKIWSENIKKVSKKYQLAIIETDTPKDFSLFVKEAQNHEFPEFGRVIAIKSFAFYKQDITCELMGFEFASEKEATQLFDKIEGLNNTAGDLRSFLTGCQIEGPVFFIQKRQTIALLRRLNVESREMTFQLFRLIHDDKEVRITGVD